MTIDSACVMMLQLCPALFRACDITTKPAPSDGLVQHVGRAAGLVARVAAGAVGDDELAVELRLRCRRGPRHVGLEQRGDPVLVAGDVARLLAHDERDGLAGLRRRRGDRARRRAGSPGRTAARPAAVGRLVEELRRSVSWLHCASTAPSWQVHGWICGPENTGPPIGAFVIVSCAPPACGVRAVTTFAPTREVGHEADDAAVGAAAERAGDVPAVDVDGRIARRRRAATTSTSASPPETRSARFDRTRISTGEPGGDACAWWKPAPTSTGTRTRARRRSRVGARRTGGRSPRIGQGPAATR